MIPLGTSIEAIHSPHCAEIPCQVLSSNRNLSHNFPLKRKWAYTSLPSASPYLQNVREANHVIPVGT
jgi:hypothetical protein